MDSKTPTKQFHNGWYFWDSVPNGVVIFVFTFWYVLDENIQTNHLLTIILSLLF
jgi:hypothetical protein